MDALKSGASGMEQTGPADLSRPRQATVICTLGSHRSGTSLTSRVLNLLGVHLGPDERVVVTGDDNPKGYWEHHQLVGINDEILARFGGRWDEPPAFPPQWSADPGLDELKEKARHLVTENFAAAPLWGWKDPRTCLTLPFWQDVIGPMRYVICIRNPSAVMASLARRDGMSTEKAERLWLAHVQAILTQTSGQPRMFVFYEDMIDDWRPDLQRFAAFIGDPERADDPRVHEAVTQFVEKELCHHRTSIEELAGDQRISFPTKSLYLAVRGHASRERAPVDEADKTLDLLGVRAIEAWDHTIALAAEHVECTRERADLAREHADLTRENAERHQLLAARETRMIEAVTRLESELRGVILERDAQARQGEAALLALQQIHGSCAWKLVTFSRALIVGFLPAGTRRRRAFDVVLRRIAQRADVDLRTA